jgi:hypothetical protein
VPVADWLIERLAVGDGGRTTVVAKIAEWRALQREGWELTVLAEEARPAPGGLRRTTALLAFGYRRAADEPSS